MERSHDTRGRRQRPPPGSRCCSPYVPLLYAVGRTAQVLFNSGKEKARDSSECFFNNLALLRATTKRSRCRCYRSPRKKATRVKPDSVTCLRETAKAGEVQRGGGHLFWGSCTPRGS
ncbi:hypothetical protein MTO96_049424 [Rhipicephalus appendiculatus]